MSATLDEISAAAREIAAEHTPPLTVVAVTSADGGSGRVEILLMVTGCHVEPCRLLVNIDRDDPDALRQALREKFRSALAAHA